LDRKIRVGAVSYLNTKPLIWGFGQGLMGEEVILTEAYPAQLATSLQEGHIDIGLIPVAALPHLGDYQIIGQHCIGCEGPVASVCLFSEVPIHEVGTILADYQSRTSVALLRYLLEAYWKVSPEWRNTAVGYEEQIGGSVAGLVIGDRALAMQGRWPYVYDLGEAWVGHTGLPFVFAAWISRIPLSADFITRFDACTGAGLGQREALALQYARPGIDLDTYYTQNISYRLDDRKREGLQRFLVAIAPAFVAATVSSTE
jgi:chorismate dehydratase